VPEAVWNLLAEETRGSYSLCWRFVSVGAPPVGGSPACAPPLEARPVCDHPALWAPLQRRGINVCGFAAGGLSSSSARSKIFLNPVPAGNYTWGERNLPSQANRALIPLLWRGAQRAGWSHTDKLPSERFQRGVCVSHVDNQAGQKSLKFQ
jgi:hypothetical protein